MHLYRIVSFTMRRGWRSVGLVVFKEAWNMPLSLFYNWSPARRAIAPRIAVWFCIVMGLRILVIETAVSIMKFSFSFPYCGKFSCPVAPLHLSSSMYQHRIVTLNKIQPSVNILLYLYDFLMTKGSTAEKYITNGLLEPLYSLSFVYWTTGEVRPNICCSHLSFFISTEWTLVLI